ncbi:hypothetical protein [Spirillospora sp. NPDC048819]|uniref:hypothetical protein n=1 Tax=Spirillospora sp. NPDC048819 TaxID=3155268 RepID=UPI0033FB272D
MTADLAYLGTELDPALNATVHADGVISPPGAAVATVVVSARGNLEIAAGTRSALSRSGHPWATEPGPSCAPGRGQVPIR